MITVHLKSNVLHAARGTAASSVYLIVLCGGSVDRGMMTESRHIVSVDVGRVEVPKKEQVFSLHNLLEFFD